MNILAAIAAMCASLFAGISIPPASDNYGNAIGVSVAHSIGATVGIGTRTNTNTFAPAPAIRNATDESENVLGPCATEDSDNCYRLFGGKDGNGKSYVVIDGRVYYLVG